MGKEKDSSVEEVRNPNTRRDFIASTIASSILVSLAGSPLPILPAHADGSPEKSTADATITDKIFIEFKGVPPASGSSGGSPDRITIGLFGNDAPQPVSVLKQLVTKEGYKSKCKPLDTSRSVRKEQLEAKGVYESCIRSQDSVGVTYDSASVWRVIKDERIDVGAVSGLFVARENPTFEDAKSGLIHDAAGVVSVRRGNDGGYGFTIFPGQEGSEAASTLNGDNIVVGRVIEGMDVVERLNSMPIFKSSGVNYMAFTGGPKTRTAPTRACRYGGPELYCNEYKPLKKVLLQKTGIL